MRKELEFLMVDDDIVDLKTIRRAFTKAQVKNKLRDFDDPEIALNFLRKQGEFKDAYSGIYPGVILLDINMPKISGVEFLRELKSDPNLSTIPVIIVTTSKEASICKECFQLGAAGFVEKPVDFDQLVSACKGIHTYWSENRIFGRLNEE